MAISAGPRPYAPPTRNTLPMVLGATALVVYVLTLLLAVMGSMGNKTRDTVQPGMENTQVAMDGPAEALLPTGLPFEQNAVDLPGEPPPLVSSPVDTVVVVLPGETTDLAVSAPSEATGDLPGKGVDLGTKLPPPVLRSVPNAGKRMALTFDDGPFELWTEAYLKLLEHLEVKATFFLTGVNARTFPDLARRIVDNGHEVGNHSYLHGRYTLMTQADRQKDLALSTEYIFRATGFYPTLFRPPYGEYNETVIKDAWELGQRTVMWSIDPKDWEKTEAGYLVQHILDRASNGAIVVLHEGKQETLLALSELVTGLRKMGYELVTLSELLAPPPQAALVEVRPTWPGRWME